MKNKLFLLVAACVLGCIKLSHAGDPVWIQGLADSRYTISQSSVSVSSETATTIAASSVYREVTISNYGSMPGGTTVYVTLDGTTGSGISGIGLPILAGEEKVIESNRAINLRLGAGNKPVDVRKLIKEKGY